MRSAILIYNPVAGRARAGRLLDRLIETLSSAWQIEPRASREPQESQALASEAAEDGADAVFALGGDGTLRECAAGVLGSSTALGFLPGGTTNVMRLPLGLPADPLAAAAELTEAHAVDMDVGLCDRTPFLMQTSAGLDAALIRALRPEEKRLLGQGSVAPAGLRSWLTYTYPELELEVDGRKCAPATWAVVSNIPYYGGRWKIAPEARLDDGKLHLVLFRGHGRLSALSFSSSLFVGRHLRRTDVEMASVEHVRIQPVPGARFQIDGDPLTPKGPVEIRISPDTLRMLVPRNRTRETQ